MSVLDYLGRMWQPKTVGKGNIQTAKAYTLQQTFAGHPIKGLTPQGLATILEHAETGDLVTQSELFTDIEERDAHVFAELSKRKRTVIGLPRIILPPSNPTTKEIETVDKLNSVIASMPDFDDMLLDLLDGIGHGFSCVELTWGNQDNVWRPIAFNHRPQSWFQLDVSTRTQIRLRNLSMDGEELWPFGWIVHKHFAKSGYLARAGLFRVLAWPWLMKQFSLRDLAQYLEIYGHPIKVGKYPRDASDEDVNTLARSIQRLGKLVSGVMPDDMSIEFLKESLGSSDPFMGMVRYCDDAISRAVLGQTLSSTTSSTGMGSGTATLHGEVRQDLMESDAVQLANTLTTQFIKPLVDINNWGEPTGRGFTFMFDVSGQDDMSIFADSIKKLIDAGLSIPEEWIRKKTGIPAPNKNETMIGGLKSIDASNLAALSRTLPPKLSDYPEQQIARLNKQMSPMVDAILKHIGKLLDASSTLEEFDKKLLAWFPEAKALDMVDVLGKAFVASELAGRYEASQDD